MCLAIETSIPSADGRAHSGSELCDSAHVVYACSESGRVRMTHAKAKHGVAKRDCVRLTLDSGESLVCASTQELMLRDGTFRAAADLAPGTSLMPLYTKRDKEGYTLVQQNYSGRWQKA